LKNNKLVEADGTEVVDQSLKDLGGELEVLTQEFIKKVKETAERHGVELVTHVKFEGPKNPINSEQGE
jgi:hypothetical protein